MFYGIKRSRFSLGAPWSIPVDPDRVARVLEDTGHLILRQTSKETD